ncbi:hypothetical protein [Mycoplasmopsis pulmonis]|uniref:hypothetical protein n=1 Tax=Mycoplasmopsis pulmonis TaxID=2107 RepID=UPI002ACDE7AA|nr:hypothetical protein [Mycoplasmopsis pulmonis]MDZ7293766.1 hypothetical protein [Mycoplasmopsis pulmonis]
MSAIVLNAIVSAGGSAGLIAIAYICFLLVKKIKKDHTNVNTNTINFNAQQKDQVIDILNEIVKENKKTLNAIDWKLQKLSIAMSYYVENNGVKPEVKENFKKILDAKKETN